MGRNYYIYVAVAAAAGDADTHATGADRMLFHRLMSNLYCYGNVKVGHDLDQALMGMRTWSLYH